MFVFLAATDTGAVNSAANTSGLTTGRVFLHLIVCVHGFTIYGLNNRDTC
jgi:hypothetical protein